MRVFLKPLAIVCALTVLTPITSQAALFEDDEARLAILDLRQQVTGFQNAIIQLQNQLDESRRENSQLRGSNELLEKRIQELVEQQKSFYKDINSRLKNLEPQQLEIEGVQGKVQPGEKEAYQEALNAFQDGNLKKSDTAFEEFVKKYPQVDIQLQLSVSPPPITEDLYDVCFRFGNPPDSRAIAKLIAPNRRILVASPNYLKKHGAPKSPNDLSPN